MNTQHKLLICYDGSTASKQAIATAANTFPAAQAVVLNVWQPVAGLGFSYMGVSGDIDDINASVEQASHQAAEEGAQLAHDAGLDAHPEILQADGSVGNAVTERCNQHDCDIVVVGTSRRSAIGGALLGSVSNAVIHHSDLPVLVVRPEPIPDSSETADARATVTSR